MNLTLMRLPNQIMGMQTPHFLLTLVALAMCTTIVLTTPHIPPPWPSPLTPTSPLPYVKKNSTTKDEFLQSHNRARYAVGVAPLKWSNKLGTNANRLVRYQRDKKGCKFAEMSMTKYGMNQLWASGMLVTPRVAVESWVEKKKYYNHGNNTCAPHHNCGVYKQVVWKKTVELGCAQVKCLKEHATLTICFYDPPGNVIGQKPY